MSEFFDGMTHLFGVPGMTIVAQQAQQALADQTTTSLVDRIFQGLLDSTCGIFVIREICLELERYPCYYECKFTNRFDVIIATCDSPEQFLARLLALTISLPERMLTKKRLMTSMVFRGCFAWNAFWHLLTEAIRAMPISPFLPDRLAPRDPVASAIQSIAQSGRPEQILRLANENLAGSELTHSQIVANCITGYEDLATLYQTPFGGWLSQQLIDAVELALGANTKPEERRTASALLDQVLLRGIETLDPDLMDWLLARIERYFQGVFQAIPAHGSPLFQKGRLWEVILNLSETDQYSDLIAWATSWQIPGSPSQWRRACLLAMTLDSFDDVERILTLAAEREIVIDGIGLFREACRARCAILPAAILDPTTCSTIRNHLPEILREVASVFQSQRFQDVLEYCTTLACPCAQMILGDPNAVPFHQGPFGILDRNHQILADLIQEYRNNKTRDDLVVIIEALATYTRNHDLPVVYYLVGDLVILVHNPCSSESPIADSLAVTGNLGSSLTETVVLAGLPQECGVLVTAVALERRIPTSEELIAACQQIGAKRA